MQDSNGNGIDLSRPVDDLEERFRRFDGVVFPAWLSVGPRINAKGDMLITLLIPYRYTDQAMELRHALGMPLQVQMRRWTGE